MTATPCSARSPRSRRSRQQQVRLPRCVVLIEACEESGSIDLPAHLAALGDALGEPSLVVCLDAECGNYEQVWCTTSLRGNLVGTLRVRVLTEGCTRAWPPALRPRRFASSSSCSRASRVRSPAICCSMSCTSACRAIGARRRAPRRRCWASRWPASCRGRRACSRSPTIPPSSSSTAPGARRSRSPAPTACRRSARRATCCCRSWR